MIEAGGTDGEDASDGDGKEGVVVRDEEEGATVRDEEKAEDTSVDAKGDEGTGDGDAEDEDGCVGDGEGQEGPRAFSDFEAVLESYNLNCICTPIIEMLRE
ncbi:hypothetical protein CJ030_MR5G025390 [Morella rubra]|uniref:Uncharacterized protein n=1 Tax=Morella rubra TaxID=262757 RepID=A0A6A1VGN2_9ROSI|nr:hypothetical protein CJ030_MR5G025390 [Morella rubra]